MTNNLPGLDPRDSFARRLWSRVLCGVVLWCALTALTGFAQDSRDDGRSLSRLFGDDLASDTLEVFRRSRPMPREERYVHLRNHVLPAGSETIRLRIDYLPTNPSPLVVEMYGSEESPEPWQSTATRRPSGGILVSPVIELIKVAGEIGKLEELRLEVDRRSPVKVEQVKSQLALKILIAWAKGDLKRAGQFLNQFSLLVRESPLTDFERGPESLVIWSGFHSPAMRTQCSDLLYYLYEQTQLGGNLHNERFKRHIASLKFQADHLLDGEASSTSRGMTGFSLKHWHPVSRQNVQTRGLGYPNALWVSKWPWTEKVASHDGEYLYFDTPLTGDFEISGVLSSFSYREIRLALGGIWFGPRYSLNDCERGTFHRMLEPHKVDPPLTRMDERMHVRHVVKEGRRTISINGRTVYEGPHGPDSDPWIAAYTPWYTSGFMEDVRITGNPQIPSEIDLLADVDLPGWLPYYDADDGIPDTSWSLAVGESAQSRTLIGHRNAELKGSFQEKLFRYHRPMLEDGAIEYEFFYQAETFAVYPALDRCCFLFDREKAGIHWLTDGIFDRTKIDPANFSPSPIASGMPLIEDDWNRVRLTLTGDVVEIALNGETIVTKRLERENLRTFGLFHYADQTEARVRNLRWRGKWPRELPPLASQELADVSWEQEIARGPELPLVFEHDFSEGLPSDKVWGAGENWQSHVKQQSDGVRMMLAQGPHTYNMLAFPFSLEGDFDVTLDFRGFQHTPGLKSEGNIQLQIYFNDDHSSECRFYRNHFHHGPKNVEHKIQGAIFRQDAPRGRYEFPSQFPQEAAAGRLRLVRRGSIVFYLYADEDSPGFRLIHREEVTDDPVMFAGIKAVLETHHGGTTTVVWKRIAVRAEKPPEPPEKPSLTVADLNRQRDMLPKVEEFLFDQMPPPQQWVITGISENIQRKPEGWLLSVPGTKFWSCTGVAYRGRLSGDFDVTLELDVLKLTETEGLEESIVLLKLLLDSRIRRGLEIKLGNSRYGKRELQIQRNTYHQNGEVRYEKLKFQHEGNASELRLARRDGVVYVIFRKSRDSEEQIFGAVELGEADVLPRTLEALVHTGGEGRETIVRFKSMPIHAERFIAP